MTIYVRILLHLSKFFVKDIHEKHLIKWAAIYTIDACKLPKVLEIMNSTYTAPRRLIKTPDEIEKCALQDDWRLKF